MYKIGEVGSTVGEEVLVIVGVKEEVAVGRSVIRLVDVGVVRKGVTKVEVGSLDSLSVYALTR